MDHEVRKIYIMHCWYGWMPVIRKIDNGIWHAYFNRSEDPLNPDWDGVPAALRKPDTKFKSCRCCRWKPE